MNQDSISIPLIPSSNIITQSAQLYNVYVSCYAIHTPLYICTNYAMCIYSPYV